MDEVLLVIAGIMHLVGIAGCVLPILPGPVLSYAGLLLVHFTRYADYSIGFLLLFAGITIAVLAIDAFVPIWGAKKYGGSKAGLWGATIGMVAGIFFFPPFGIIIGPFLGAVAVELVRGETQKNSLRAGWGTLVGFMLGTGFKLIAAFVMAYYYVVAWF